MITQEFIGISGSRWFDEALQDALMQVELHHLALPGADMMSVAEVVSTRFTLGGIAGLDRLEDKVSVLIG